MRTRRDIVAGIACAFAVLAFAQDASARLLASVERGDVAGVRRALAEGARVDVRDARGRPALLVATYRNDVAIARALIDAGADVNAKDSIDDSAFLYAGAEGKVEILKLTLAHGADLRSLNRYGGTALIPAAHHGYIENVRILLGTKIDIDHVNNLGWTALLEAVILGDGGTTHTEIVRLLVEAGANPNLADRGGVTPFMHARQRGYGRIVAIIEKSGGR